MFRLDEVIAQRNFQYQRSRAVRRSQQSQSVQLRKQQRLEKAMNFRRMNQQSQWEDLDALYPQHYTVSSLPAVQEAIATGSREKLIFAAFVVRKILCADKPPPVRELHEEHIFDHVPKWILRCDVPQLQYEALRIVNVVGDSSIRVTEEMVKVGLLQGLAIAAESRVEAIRVEALSALASTASVCLSAADQLAEYCTVLRVFQTLQCSKTEVKVTCWLLSSIAKGRSLDQIYEFALPFLVSQLNSDEDVEVLADCCHVLSCLSAKGAESTAAAIPRLTSLLESSEYGVQLEALRALGNFSASDEHAESLSTPQLLKMLAEFVQSPKKPLRKEAVWILSNICAGTVEHIQAVVDLGVIPKIIELISTVDLDVCREACWVVYNILQTCSNSQLQALLDTPLVFNLCRILRQSNRILHSISLQCIKSLLLHFQKRAAASDSINPVKELVSACGSVGDIEDLQSSEDAEVREIAEFLVREFFEDVRSTNLSDDDETFI